MFPTGGSTYLFERLMLSGKTDFVVSVAVLAQVEVSSCHHHSDGEYRELM